jgi:hypothetical protein
MNVIEQFTYLLFLRLLGEQQNRLRNNDFIGCTVDDPKVSQMASDVGAVFSTSHSTSHST